MARHAQPREVAELKGATKKNPQRYKTAPPKSSKPLGGAPNWCEKIEKAAWVDLQRMTPAGVLTFADRAVMELSSALLSQFRADRLNFPAAKMTHLVGCLARLGLTPADRQRLTRDVSPRDGDSFSDF